MRRKPFILVGQLNIVASPHPPGVYRRLIEGMKDAQVPSRGSEFAMIGTMVSVGLSIATCFALFNLAQIYNASIGLKSKKTN